jgi:hypothetical protein
MTNLLHFLAEMRYFLGLICAVLGIAVIAATNPDTIDETKLQSVTGRVVREVSGSGLTLTIQPKDQAAPITVNVRNYMMPPKGIPSAISETVTVRFEQPDNVIAIAIDGRDYMTIAETRKYRQQSKATDWKIVTTGLPIALPLFIASLWAHHTRTRKS